MRNLTPSEEVTSDSDMLKYQGEDWAVTENTCRRQKGALKNASAMACVDSIATGVTACEAYAPMAMVVRGAEVGGRL